MSSASLRLYVHVFVSYDCLEFLSAEVPLAPLSPCSIARRLKLRSAARKGEGFDSWSILL